MQRLGHLERRQVACDDADAVDLRQEAAVSEHAHGLDGVERDALRRFSQPVPEVVGQARNEPGQQLVHRLVVERLERQRRRAPGRPREARMPIGDLRTSERQDEDRVVPTPVEEVLDEGDEAFVRPVDVLEHEHERPLLGEPLEESPPGREEILPIGRVPLGETEQMEQAGLDPLPLRRVGEMGLERRAELGRCALGRTRSRRSSPGRGSSRPAPSRRRRRRRRGSGRGATRSRLRGRRCTSRTPTRAATCRSLRRRPPTRAALASRRRSRGRDP